MTITSEAFAAGERIPQRCAYEDEGQNLSPALAWGNVPEGARELALICDDPDAPRDEPWVHWVLYRIPASTRSLKEGGKGIGTAGRNDFGDTGWGGPLPPPGHGTHRYHFKLYALDAEIELGPGATKGELEAAMQGHVLAQAELVGTYSR